MFEIAFGWEAFLNQQAQPISVSTIPFEEAHKVFTSQFVGSSSFQRPTSKSHGHLTWGGFIAREPIEWITL